MAKSEVQKLREEVEADMEGMAQLVASYEKRIAELEAQIAKHKTAIGSMGLYV